MVILLDIVGMRDTYGMQRMAHVLPPFSLQQSPVREKARAKAATGVSDVLHWHLIMLHSACASIICIPD